MQMYIAVYVKKIRLQFQCYRVREESLFILLK